MFINNQPTSITESSGVSGAQKQESSKNDITLEIMKN